MLGPGNIKTLLHAALYPVNWCAGVYRVATNFAARNNHDSAWSGDKASAYDMPTAPLPSSVSPLRHSGISTRERTGCKNTSRLESIHTACTEDQLARASIALLYSFAKE